MTRHTGVGAKACVPISGDACKGGNTVEALDMYVDEPADNDFRLLLPRVVSDEDSIEVGPEAALFSCPPGSVLLAISRKHGYVLDRAPPTLLSTRRVVWSVESYRGGFGRVAL